MELKIKVVVFEHPEPQTWCNYCGYSPANGYFCSGIDVTDVSNRIRSIIEFELQQRESFPNHLLKFGWKVSDKSIIPPIFADEELVQRAENSYGLKIDNPIIVELNVEIPQPQALF